MDKCTCHLLKEKCKSYSYQPAKEVICQACLNQPIITVATRRFQVSRGNSPELAAVGRQHQRAATTTTTSETPKASRQQARATLFTGPVSYLAQEAMNRISDGRNNDASCSPLALNSRGTRSSRCTTTVTPSTKSSTPSSKSSIDKQRLTDAQKAVAEAPKSNLASNAKLVGDVNKGGSGTSADTASKNDRERVAVEKTLSQPQPPAANQLRRSASAASRDTATGVSPVTTNLAFDGRRLAAGERNNDVRLSSSSSNRGSSDDSDDSGPWTSRMPPARAEAAVSKAPRSGWHHRRRRLPWRHMRRPPLMTSHLPTQTTDAGSRHRGRRGRSGLRPTTSRREQQVQQKQQKQQQEEQQERQQQRNSSAGSSDPGNSSESTGANVVTMRGNRTEMSRESQTPEKLLRDLLSAGKLRDAMGTSSPHRTPRTSETRIPKSDQQRTQVEKAIMDFFSTHKGDSAPRVVVPTQGDGKWPQVKPGGMFRIDAQRPAAQISGGHLLKDPIVIGGQSVFEQFVSRQFILPMFDSLLDAFLRDSSTLRASCSQTRCRLELSRRILNRRVLHGSWVKYMVITISGPTLGAIDNCDRLLKKYLQAYRLRRAHDRETTCCLFFREDIPDNATLCFSHQRTGVATTRYGNLKLQSPFLRGRKTGHCGKQGLAKYGRAALSSRQSKDCIKFVYSNSFQNRTGSVPSYCTGVAAIGKRQSMQDEVMELRHAALESRKRMLLPLHRV